MNDILARIARTTVADLEDIRSDFDDLVSPAYKPRLPHEMVRTVDAALASERENRCFECGYHPCRCNMPASFGGASGAPKVDTWPVLAGRGQPTERQCKFIMSLINELHTLDLDSATKAMKYTRDMTANAAWDASRGGNVSIWINRLKAKVTEAKAATRAVTPIPEKTNTWTTWRELAAKLVEIGGQHGARFAIDTEDGAVNDLAFWWIVKSTNPETKLTRYFIRQVIGGQGAVRVRMSPEAMISIARKIEAAGPMEAMIRYGQEIGSCGHCGRELTNDKSRAFGMGPKCRRDKGM